MTSKIHPVHVKNTHCYKTFLVKHFLFGALAWQTVDVRHKPFLFSHLACSLLQWGAPLRPGPKHWSGRHEVPTLPAPVSLLLLFLQNSCAWMVLFWQRIFFFSFWGGFGRNEEGVADEGFQDLTCPLFSLSKTRGLQRLRIVQQIWSIVISCLSWVNTFWFNESFVWTRTEKLGSEQGNNLYKS